MKEPTFLTYDSDDEAININWATREKRLSIFIDDETGIEIFGVSNIDSIIDIVNFESFTDAYKWFEEK